MNSSPTATSSSDRGGSARIRFRKAIAGSVVAFGLVLFGVSPAQANTIYVSSLNCGNKYVKVYTNSTGTTDHVHRNYGGGSSYKTFYNGGTYIYRTSQFYKVLANATTMSVNGNIGLAGRMCGSV